MSAQSSQPADDGPSAHDDSRAFTGGIGSMVAPAAEDETAPPTRPTFTARSSGPATVVAEPLVPEPPAPETAGSGPAVSEPDTAEPDVSEHVVSEPPAAEPVVAEPLPPAPAFSSADAAVESTALADLDEPLLGDVAAIRARWQRVQAGFVDDPNEAVGDAADLIEQTAQALVGALRQRQRQLRVLWERGPVGGAANGTAPGDGESPSGADTEHLRLMMQRYRSLFNQLARP